MFQLESPQGSGKLGYLGLSGMILKKILKCIGTSEQGNEPSVVIRVGHFWLAKQLPAF